MHGLRHMTLNAKVRSARRAQTPRDPSLVEEVGNVHPQRVRNVQQVAELHLLAGFHPLDGAAVQAGLVGQGFLGHVQVQAPDANAVADGLSGRSWRVYRKRGTQSVVASDLHTPCSHYTLNWRTMLAKGIAVVGPTVKLELDIQAMYRSADTPTPPE